MVIFCLSNITAYKILDQSRSLSELNFSILTPRLEVLDRVVGHTEARRKPFEEICAFDASTAVDGLDLVTDAKCTKPKTWRQHGSDRDVIGELFNKMLAEFLKIKTRITVF